MIEKPAQPLAEVAPPQKYTGNTYDLYALIAGTLGGSTLLMCVSFNMAIYCMPLVPLILGIIALRKADLAADPHRTRNLAWLGIAGGGLGTLFIIAIIILFILYFAFIFAVIGGAMQSVPRR